jgi:hypothetical protein
MPTVETQEERADETQRYLGEILSRPYMVGAHWFRYIDQPDEGRGDGENSHFGLVTVQDDVYTELTERHTEVNGSMYGRPLALPVAFISPRGARDTTSGVLGERTFTIAAPTGLRTGFFIYLLSDANLALEVNGDPLVIEGGEVGENGVAPLVLTQDALVGMSTLAGDSVCLRFAATGSSGSIACDGGVGHDVIVSQDEGESPPPAVFQTFQGTDSGPGAATLLVPIEIAELPPGSTFEDCLTATYQPQRLMALSTATVTSIKGPNQFDKVGENFVCGTEGADWRLPDGPGMFVLGYPRFDSRLPGGELAAALGFADREIICE